MDKIKFLNIKFSKFFFIIKIPVVFLFPEIPCYSNIYSSELTFISNHRSRWKIRKFQIGFLEIFQNFESKKNWMENILPLIDFQKISRTKSRKKIFSCIIRPSEYSTTPILKNFSIHPSNFQLVQPVPFSKIFTSKNTNTRRVRATTKRSLEKEKKERTTEVFEMIEKV